MVHSNNGCGELDKWIALFGGDYGALLKEVLEKAIGIPVDTPAEAGEGGAWGMAVLSAYRAHVLAGGTLPLVDFLANIVH